ncbi:hypothetical protein J2W32_004079 [Variovorax boronicumulans]|uniref:Uncharacterized protein n=1 Tax=Variovorax boronicumulans TaxID=436515 RepID=A0AAW8D5A1_9BURK|nr:hypothetical protein [Variovorax boronicumulans]MDP9895203.1 hypothetical protein [Variovorax boronicumulans]MDQ0034240.1 hypothetical protein [Variovorax boronicumulans]MDQ0055021.1 hypothetical protein [Variovorax boronicumulans]
MKSNTRSIVLALLAVGGMATAGVASAQGSRGGTYQQELAVCGHNQQDRAACIREAGAARQEAARGGLTGAPDYRANALARCGLQQSPGDRRDCEARVLGGAGNTSASVDGSVMGGGVIRESVTTVVMPAPMPAERAPAPIMAPMPAERMPDPMMPPPRPAPMPAPLR